MSVKCIRIYAEDRHLVGARHMEGTPSLDDSGGNNVTVRQAFEAWLEVNWSHRQLLRWIRQSIYHGVSRLLYCIFYVA